MGNCGCASTATDDRVLLVGAALLRFLGDAFFIGDIGSGLIEASGSKISGGSTLSPVRVLRVRAAVRGVEGTSAVLRLVWRLGLGCSAGVNSSSSSSPPPMHPMFSSSDSSMTTFLRKAARRDGLVGDMVAINVECSVDVGILKSRFVCLRVSLIGDNRRR